MITGISIVSVWVLDQDSAKEFYAGKLGFTVTNDLKLDNGMRWLTVRPPGSGSQELVLMDPLHSMLDEETAQQVRALVAKGALSPGVMATSDCKGDHSTLAGARRRVHPGAGRAALRRRGDHARRLGQLVQLHPAQVPGGQTLSRAAGQPRQCA